MPARPIRITGHPSSWWNADDLENANAPDQRQLRDETVHLLTVGLDGNGPALLLSDAFAHLPNDPSARLRTDAPAGVLARDWTKRLWDAKCIAGHSPLQRLLVACFQDRREPEVELTGGFNGLLEQLDAACADEPVAPMQPPADASGSSGRALPVKPLAIVFVLILILIAIITGIGLNLWPKHRSLSLALNQPDDVDADLKVNFTHGGTDGRLSRLQRGDVVPVLRSGDRFAIEVSASRNTYLYIAHSDSAGCLRMLLADDRALAEDPTEEPNLVRAGQSFELPGPGYSYKLDEIVGVETFRIIYSQKPRPGLRDAHLAASKRDCSSSPGDTPRGAAPEQNAEPSGAALNAPPFSAACGKDEPSCKQAVFRIEHLPAKE